MGVTVQVDSSLLIYSFRYALGRRTGAPGDVAAALVEHGEVLQVYERHQIVREIEQAIAEDRAGAPCDVDEWRQVVRAFAKLDGDG